MDAQICIVIVSYLSKDDSSLKDLKRNTRKLFRNFCFISRVLIKSYFIGEATLVIIPNSKACMAKCHCPIVMKDRKPGPNAGQTFEKPEKLERPKIQGPWEH